MVPPAHPLLKGTKRGSLIDAGQLAECEIRVIDLPHFQSISLINAMLDLGDTVIEISQVFNSYILGNSKYRSNFVLAKRYHFIICHFFKIGQLVTF